MGTEVLPRLAGFLFLCHGLKVGWVKLPVIAVVDIFDAANEVIALQLEVDGRTVFDSNGDLALCVWLDKVVPR